MDKLILVPHPKKIKYIEGEFLVPFKGDIVLQEVDNKEVYNEAKLLQDEMKKIYNKHYPISVNDLGHNKKVIYFKKNKTLNEESYILKITEQSIVIEYLLPVGAFYGIMTLKQIMKQSSSKLPCIVIEDESDFKARGFMLDISRNKIPKMNEIYDLIDLMADVKLNQLQLYIEGFSYAYPSFPQVWEDKTPLTGEEILEIELYCKKRHIELVANHNCFGHMTAWLGRKEYNHLAECPGGYDVDYGKGREIPGCIDPKSEEAFTLIKKMFDDHLPYFSSEYVNIGCDETFELGLGKSKELCENEGKGRVYIDFLLKVYNEIKSRDKKIMCWGDIIIEYPELIKELPKDIIALEWGYEADHPFEDHSKRFKESGIPYYVCPGTSSWNTILGRTDNMLKNLYNAGYYGKLNGAIGYLITDWGDNGHWQYKNVSLPGIVYGASICWGVEENKELEIDRYLSKFIYKDTTLTIGKLILDMGNYYLEENKKMHNNTYATRILLADLEDKKLLVPYISDLNHEIIDNVESYIIKCENRLKQTDIRCEDADLIYQEILNGILMVKTGCKIGHFKLMLDDDKKQEKVKLIEEVIPSLEKMIHNHKKVWLKRNRLGGLKDSCKHLNSLLVECKKYIS